MTTINTTTNYHNAVRKGTATCTATLIISTEPAYKELRLMMLLSYFEKFQVDGFKEEFQIVHLDGSKAI